MSDKPATGSLFSVRFPAVNRKHENHVTSGEFDEMFELSGEKNRTSLIHTALRHYQRTVGELAKQRYVNMENHNKRQMYELLDGYLPGMVIDKVLADYAKNDAAHLEDHAINVVLHAAEIIERFPELQSRQNRMVILAGALMHDAKCHVSRDKHHILGALAVYREYLQCHPVTRAIYTQDMVTMIEECVLEHRASWKQKRSHDASEAVAAADRGKPDLYGYMRRAVRFRYAQLEQGTVVTEDIKRTIIADSIAHMHEKFGNGGYAWDSMPKYTLLMYEAEITEMKNAVAYPNSHLFTTALERFDEWVS